MSELAVSGCTLTATCELGQFSATSVVPSNSPSTDVLVDTNGVFFDKITALITVGVLIPFAPVSGTTNEGKLASGTVDISGTASDILDASGNKAVQKGDNGKKSLTFVFTTTSTPPSTITKDYEIKVEVTDAGQTDVIAS